MPTDAVAFTNAHFGAGVGPIYLDNVACSGSESNLTECSRSFIVSCYSHSEDAGVRCQGELYFCSCASRRTKVTEGYELCDCTYDIAFHRIAIVKYCIYHGYR